MMRITQPTQAVTPMLLRNADGAVSPHPDSDPKAFAMDVALKYPRAMTPRYATNMNGRRLRLGDGTSPTSPWRLFGRLIFFAERNPKNAPKIPKSPFINPSFIH